MLKVREMQEVEAINMHNRFKELQIFPPNWIVTKSYENCKKQRKT
jgi:hypothetical protein